MIQIETLNQQIKEAENYHGSEEYLKDTNADRSKKKKRYATLLKRLVPIRNFMLDGLSEEYLSKEKNRIERRIQLLNDSFPLWQTTSGIKDYFAAKKEYEKLNDYATLKRHLQNIHYILTN